ncbi:MAG: hypothetical protein KTR16_08580 [Acidiferrobacterales bacterium]|nr:hypothetical protein [Acidiferrobacterales bacterium]
MRQLKRFSTNYLLSFLCALSIAISLTDRAKACSAAPQITEWLESVEYLYEASEYIVLAKTISSKAGSYATFLPLKEWKGDKGNKKIVAKGTTGPCGLVEYPFAIGNQYLLYLVPEKNKWYWPWGNTYIALHQNDEDSIGKNSNELDLINN